MERASRQIEILSLRRASLQGESLVLDVSCSKGTYVRTLAADIGRALGCGAYLVGLRRTAVGGFDLAQATTLPALEAAGVEGARAGLLPVDVLVRSLPRLECPPEEARRFTQGQVVACPGGLPGQEFTLYGPGGRFLGVGLCEGAGLASPERLMATGTAVEAP